MHDDHAGPDAIGFVEKLLILLDEGRKTATYKYAVLLALMDACMERSAPDGGPPTRISTGAIAEKVIERYWPHSRLFDGADGTIVLHQNRGGQAEILTMICAFRERLGPRTATTVGQARIADPDGFAVLVREVEWKLIEMPLPRLQQFGAGYDAFLYDITWTTEVRRSDFTGDAYDFALRLRPSVGEHLVRLSGLLRPLIQRQWADLVAAFNRSAVHESGLDAFLFGEPRRAPRVLVDGLRQLQTNRCFYCEATMRRAVEVDHFIPWARHPDDAIQNLVLAHRSCNNAKRDFLAAALHLAHWNDRLTSGSNNQLHQLAVEHRWPSADAASRNVARAIYLRLPSDAKLWLREREFVDADHDAVLASLATSLPMPADRAAERSVPFDADVQWNSSD